MSQPLQGYSKRRLAIVQVMSNAQRIPPYNQGGTEKIVSELTEELVRRGHRVTVFAPQGSRTSARLIPFPKGMRDQGIRRYVLARLPEMTDLIHDHTFRSVLGRRSMGIPTVCTIHLPVRNRVEHPVYVSRRARQVMGKGKGFYIYNGIKPSDYEYSNRKLGYLLYMGRILPAKGVHLAIQIALASGRKLIIAGPVKNRAYFQRMIAPHLGSRSPIRYVGSVGGKQKLALLKHAGCVLFPSTWEEPFGLVMLEAMVSGTPVLAFRRGAAPEVLAGFPGLICKSVGEMAGKVNQWDFPSPNALRQYVLNRFTTERMTTRYEQLYRRVLSRNVTSGAIL